MSDERTPRERIVGLARDFLVISGVVSMLLTAAAIVFRPYWLPFSNLPDELISLGAQLGRIEQAVNEGIEPRLINVDGPGQIVGDREVMAGGSVTILYYLRRNASCDSDIIVSFFDVNRGVRVQGQTIPSVKAPVTKSYGLFLVQVKLPPDIMPGQYVYSPTVSPIECGIYGDVNIPPSQIFTVTR